MMDPVTVVAALIVASAEAGDEGPIAPPSNVSLFYYNGTFIGVQWTNGDVTASTEIGIGDGIEAEPTAVFDTVGPGVSTYETETTGVITHHGQPGIRWWVRHVKGRHRTPWVPSSNAVQA